MIEDGGENRNTSRVLAAWGGVRKALCFHLETFEDARVSSRSRARLSQVCPVS